MKKVQLKIAVLSLSALAFVSCKKDDKSGTAGEMMSFTASIGGGAKTEIDGFDMKWTNGDSILINGTKFTGEKEGDGKTAVFTGETVDSPYEAYFLADYTQKDGKYVLPATQTYNGNNLSKVNPMYAKSETTDLQFHNICAMLELKVKGKGKVKEIVVTATKGDLLSGAFEFPEGKTYAKVIDGGSNTVTLDCGEGVELKAEKDTTFYIALPQGNYTDLKFELKNGSSVWDTTFSMSFKAGQIRTKVLAGVSISTPTPPTPPIPDGALSGEFTVGMDGSIPRKVHFSKGNLIATVNASGIPTAWRFAANQYDRLGTEGANQTIGTAAGDVDLFGWSTTATNNNYGINTSVNINDYSGNFIDWGTAIDDKGTWRTLNAGIFVGEGEWEYLFTKRNTNSGIRYAKAKIDGVPGFVLVPDDWENTDPHTLVYPDQPSLNYNYSNIISATDWKDKFESAGAVFLPIDGYREGGTVKDDSFYGCYWSSTAHSMHANYACCVDMPSNKLDPNLGHYRYRGMSVRLVCAVVSSN